MSLVKILAVMTGDARDAITLKTAIAAARPFNAHVEALLVQEDPRDFIPYTQVPLSPAYIEAIIENGDKLARETASAVHELFAKTAREESVKIVKHPQRAEVVTVSFRNITGHLQYCLADEARLVDLVVFPPVAKAGQLSLNYALDTVLTKVERPALLCADRVPSAMGQKIAIGWDGRGSDAHALLAAIPFLRKAKRVVLVTVQQPPGIEHSIAEARGYLHLHDIKSDELMAEPGEAAIANILFGAAAADGCDLLVVGGYGHSRVRETIFGGVTDSIVSHPHIPVFMVH